MIAVAEIARDLRLGRETVAVLGHAVVHRDLTAIDRCAVRRLEMEHPAVQLALGDGVSLRTNRRSVRSGRAQTRARVVQAFGGRANIMQPVASITAARMPSWYVRRMDCM